MSVNNKMNDDSVSEESLNRAIAELLAKNADEAISPTMADRLFLDLSEEELQAKWRAELKEAGLDVDRMYKKFRQIMDTHRPRSNQILDGVRQWIFEQGEYMLELSREGIWALNRALVPGLTLGQPSASKNLPQTLLENGIKVALTDITPADGGGMRICFRWLADIPAAAPEAMIVFRDNPLPPPPTWEKWNGRLDRTQVLIVTECPISAEDFEKGKEEAPIVSFSWDSAENRLVVNFEG